MAVSLWVEGSKRLALNVKGGAEGFPKHKHECAALIKYNAIRDAIKHLDIFDVKGGKVWSRGGVAANDLLGQF